MIAVAPAQLPAFHVLEPALRCRMMSARADAQLAKALLPQPQVQANSEQQE